MSGDRCAAVNVDIDSLYLYYRLHGLDEALATNVIWDKAVPRFVELFAEHGIKATFFVVASDLQRWPAAMQGAKSLAEAGHELANHSFSHPYELSHLSIEEVREEVGRAHDLISEAQGRSICGFRAPGYNMSDTIYRVLSERNYLYSSSIFPSPPYMLAKWGVMGAMKLRGKESQAIWGDPRMMFASRSPRHRRSVLELPITVVPLIRFPFIGTTLSLLGDVGYSALRPLLARSKFLNLEFHGIDLIDLEADGIEPVLMSQRDLRIPLAKKRALFSRVLGDLKRGWEIGTLEQLAPRFKGPKAR